MTIKLLAVDDSNTMRKVLGITFAADGFDATICKSSSEALDAVRANPPELALVDAYLAGENGYEVCRQLKAASPSTVVLMLTSKQRPYEEGAGAAAGAAGNFDKPFDSQKIIDKLLSLVGATAPAAVSRGTDTTAPKSAYSAAPRPSFGTSPGIAVPPVAPLVSSSPASSAAAARPPASQRPAMAEPAPRAPQVVPAAPMSGRSASLEGGSAGLPAEFSAKLAELGLSADQLAGVLALSREVVEQVVWEVVPALAETMIKEEIRRLTAE